MYRGKGVYYILYVYIGSRGKGVPNRYIGERKCRAKKGEREYLYM